MIDPENYNRKLYEIAVEGKSGDGKWELKKDLLSTYTILDRYNADSGTYYKDSLTGSYPRVRLLHDPSENLVMMANLPSDHEDHIIPLKLAKGRILTSGLGLGLFPLSLTNKLNSGEVESIDIVEKDIRVVELVKPYVTEALGNKVNIMVMDLKEYLKVTTNKYDLIYIDIWPTRWEACAEGPYICRMAERCLSERGIVKFWVQEVRERLLQTRGLFDYGQDREEPCRLCGIKNHPHLYGGLCTDCANEYERYLFKTDFDACLINCLGKLDEEYPDGAGVEIEDVTNRRLTSKLQLYLWEEEVLFNTELKKGLRPDITINGRKIIVEAKTNLVTTTDKRDLSDKVRDYINKTDYIVYLVIYWDTTKERLNSLLESISEYLDRVKVICWNGESYFIVTPENIGDIKYGIAEEG